MTTGIDQAIAHRVPDCVVCDDVGCEFCGQTAEPWPAEFFADLSDRDVEQLVADGFDELFRRREAAHR